MSTISETDVLIVGAGPAGLIAAWWMAKCGIRLRVIDKDPNELLHGRADGMRPRTVEILDSMGSRMMETITQESFPMLSSHNWMRDENDNIQRVERLDMYEDHRKVLATPFHSQALSQGRIERIIQDAILDLTNGSVVVERGVAALGLEYDQSLEQDHSAYPIAVTIHKQRQNQNQTEKVKARYLIGCDGARSWLRRELGYKTEGSNTNTIWVALDVYPITDYPDVRKPSSIQTPKGTMLMIPREKGLLRIYVPMGIEGQDAERDTVTLEQASAYVKPLFKPYKFDFERCNWWSAYSLGQRHSERNRHDGNRMFLAGDSVHNNSPLIGLGLNVSVHDAWNLGWKIAMAFSCPTGVDRNAILSTYEAERLPIAKTLVHYDRNWTSLFNKALVEPAVFIQRYIEFRNFSDGYRWNYPDSRLINRATSKQELASNLVVGESFTHARVSMHADGQTYWTCSRLRADGRFNIILLAGNWDDAQQKERVQTFCQKLEEEKDGTSLLYTRYPYPWKSSSSFYNYDKSNCDRGRPHSLINILTIHTGGDDTPLLEFPTAVRGPYHHLYGWDYSRLLVDMARPYDRYADGKAYEAWGVDRRKGAVVVLRPDMHVGWLGDLEDFDALEGYFETFLGAAWRE